MLVRIPFADNLPHGVVSQDAAVQVQDELQHTDDNLKKTQKSEAVAGLGRLDTY